MAPWNGKSVPITIRMLDSVTLSSCGDFNTITNIVRKGEEGEQATQEDIITTKNIHENVLKLALVHPTFKEIEEHLMTKDFYTQKEKEIADIRSLIEKLNKEVDKAKYSTHLDMLELSIAFLIPEDFTARIISIILQKEATDVSKLTRDSLLKAGFLAEKYNVRPSEYMEGTFTEKQNLDIDVTAFSLVADYREQQKVEKNGMHWIRGKGK